MSELSASTGWNGGGAKSRAKRYSKPGTRDLEF